MINYELPTNIEMDGELHPIRNKGDYRVILDVIAALNDDEITDDERLQCALFIFYENIGSIKNIEAAARGMMKFISLGEEDDDTANPKPKMMDWEHDFKILVSPINRVLGCEVRTVNYLHWWTFVGAYYEIGEGTFSTVVSIRKKKQKGQKLDKWEQEYYREHRKMVDLPKRLTAEEQELLNSDW